MPKKIINIGILAHVDAGKTTITEQLLYLGGAIKEAGNVDKGSATTDQLSIEKQRGISVKTATATFQWEDVQINIIDTPGHTDFISEIDRVLQILDCAILVISSVEGIQSHTFLLWEALKKLNIPTLLFINKIDRSGSEFDLIRLALIKDLKINCFPLSSIKNEADNNAIIIDYNDEDFSKNSNIDLNTEAVAEIDEGILEKYLEGERIDTLILYKKAIELFNKKALTPILAGSAKNAIGIKELLNHIIQFIPPNDYDLTKAVSAIVYKIEHDKKHGRLIRIKLLSGKLRNKETVYCHRLEKEVKIAQIKKRHLSKIQDIDLLEAGDIGILTGVPDLRIGDVLGKDHISSSQNKLQEAVLSTQVKPLNEAQIAQLAEVLQELSIEDPDLEFKWYKSENELQLKLHGPIQKEVLQDLIKERYGIEAVFEDPSVIYKETPKKKAEGFVRYWMPKPCWAIMKFEIEAGERGSGIVYKSKVGVNDIQQKYQNEIANTIPKALEQGIKGWEVTDIKITLIEGEDHTVHSNPGDFILATPMGIMNGLQNSDTQLLEPMLKFEIKAHESLLGSVNSDLIQMRAEIHPPEFEDENFILSGKVPVSTSLDYSIRLNSLSSGKAKYIVNFGGYRECTDDEGKVRPFKGVCPLDESLWILHNRGAYKI